MNTKEKPGILIVDDDRHVLKSLKVWLKNEGYRALVANCGEGAVAALENGGIDVALVDFRMGKENGLQVARRLKDIDDELKIVMLTGFPSYETAVDAMKVGIFDYLSKGATNEKILETIRRALEEKEGDVEATDPEPQPRDAVRLILFCNHSLVKERLENVSGSTPFFKLVRSFPRLDALNGSNITRQVDVALVCATCNLKQHADAYKLLPRLYRELPEIKPVIINENFTDEEKLELLKLGVRGFSPRDLSSEELGKALCRVKSGEIWVSRSVVDLSLRSMTGNQYTPQMPNDGEKFGLTNREVEILRTIALGLKNKEIADKLFISEKTVKTHINRVFKKLGAATRAQAVLIAVENRII